MMAIQKPLEVGPTGFPELAVNFSMAVVETSVQVLPWRRKSISGIEFLFFGGGTP